MTAAEQGHSGLELRDFVPADLPILFVFQDDPVANAMAAFPSRDPEAFAAHWRRILADETVLTKTIVLDGQVVGSVASFVADGDRAVGYWIGREHWGRGIATAALLAFVQLDPGRPLYAHVAAHNLGSIRVLEKCGFVATGLPGAPGTDGVVELRYVLGGA